MGQSACMWTKPMPSSGGSILPSSFESKYREISTPAAQSSKSANTWPPTWSPKKMALPNSSVPVVKKDTPGATVLSAEQVEAVIRDLPVQGRVVLRLLLLQYLDLTQEDIAYMAADCPDPRFQAGNQPKTPIISREAIQGIADRVEQYRSRVRRKRERTWLQMECLRKQITLSESFCSLAEQLLVSRFSLALDRVQELKKQARTALSKPVLRA